jgi:beta-aspartyl-peptidase (threonine type)
MKNILMLLIGFFVLFSCNNSNTVSENTDISKENLNDLDSNFGIVIHGGAGTILKENMTDSMEMAYRIILEKAIRTGHTILEQGGSSLEAVTATINIMEDSPLFNSGKGAVFTHEETNELDASIMDGATLNAGAVAGVTRIKNPIDLALAVMNNSPHVLLTGEGAEIFAKGQGFEWVDPSYFFTENRYQSLIRIKKKNEAKSISFNDPYINDSKYGTVGCVALDKNGDLAAGTSTGGMTNKRWNRVGDSPIIGAGTYANNNTCAVSSTGWGEYFMRGLVAYDISAMMEYKGVSLNDAATEVIQNKLTELGGTGGIVAIDNKGNIAMEFNTSGMFRAHMDAEGTLKLAIFKND